MTTDDPSFLRPSLVERGFNRFFGTLVGLGLCPPHNYLLQVRGRRSGRLYSAPIDLLTIEHQRFLVCPRGRSQWVRNAEASGRVVLKKAFSRHEYLIRPLPDAEKAEILKRYLDRFKTTVQRYFPLPAGSPADVFAEFANRYPVFELLTSEESPRR
jgi:deazaflavin-dependent oxidoreductase (nitroreductase family)